MNSGNPTTPLFKNSLRADTRLFLAAALLLAANIGAAFLPLHGWHAAITLGLSVSQALLILLYWMDLKSGSVLIRYCVALPFAWLILLIGLSWADTLTRQLIAAPW